MSDSDKEQVIADERLAERRYNEELDAKARRVQRGMNGAHYNQFTANSVSDAPHSGTLIGRVRLADVVKEVGGDEFYIGTAPADADGLPVYSIWAPTFGGAFYLGGQIDGLGEVHAIRTLDRTGAGPISDYAEEVLTKNPPEPLFRKSRTLAVPKPTARVLPQVRTQAGEDRPVPATPSPVLAKQADISRPTKEAGALEVRARSLLLQKLAAPRRSDMGVVLATLQPDQYRAITRPATDSVIFQGHPGTGKTIVAVNRLAYLTSSDAEAERAEGLVMLVGPTREYVRHVAPAVSKLTAGDDDQVKVVALPDLLQEFAGIDFGQGVDARIEHGTFVQDELVDFLRATLKAVRVEGALAGLDGREAVRVAYERLRTDPAFPDGRAMDREWFHFFRGLPPFEMVGQHPELRALLAFLGARRKVEAFYQDLAHVIVDEAQDIYPLEWEVLGRLGASQGWTILGDLNQRRGHTTYRSWKPIASRLGIEIDGKAPVVKLERGYRSTAPIMRFANRLLPPQDRDLVLFQTEGPEPKRTRSPQRDKLAKVALGQAIELNDRHSDGSTAIIAVSTAPIEQELRRAGWSIGPTSDRLWSGQAGTLRVLTPDQARGLEFDAVVVVEPAEFPAVEGEGKLGSLYTSLTRANKELAVVHHKALPDALRG